MSRQAAAWWAGTMLAGCASLPPHHPTQPVAPAARDERAPLATVKQAPAQPPAPPAQDGPPAPEEIPPDLASIPDAVPKAEPKSETGNPDSYVVYGERYRVLDAAHGFKQRGYASWYGRKFQGQRTSSGEHYDMFKMTAAHKTLPIPCYVRVTNLDNGRQVVVRVNDRGPFHSQRIIDLSYAAAAKLGMLGKGSAPVEIQVLDPQGPGSQIAANDRHPAVAPAAPSTPKLQLATSLNSAPDPTVAPAPDAGAQLAKSGFGSPAAPAQWASNTAPMLPGAHYAPSAPDPVQPPDPTPAPPGNHEAHYLQAGLFSDPVNAATLREQLLALGVVNVILKSEARGAAYVHRVLIGPYADAAALEAMRKKLAALRLPTLRVAQ
jgi:rare lipoprotein A